MLSGRSVRSWPSLILDRDRRVRKQDRAHPVEWNGSLTALQSERLWSGDSLLQPFKGRSI